MKNKSNRKKKRIADFRKEAIPEKQVWHPISGVTGIGFRKIWSLSGPGVVLYYTPLLNPGLLKVR